MIKSINRHAIRNLRIMLIFSILTITIAACSVVCVYCALWGEANSSFNIVYEVFTSDPRLLVCCSLLPFILVVILVASNFIKDIALIMIELDIVEEKRKLTDDICVKNKIGYQMSTKVKYKVLAQAKPEEFSLYMSLLWENGTTPANVKKYYKRKALLLRKNQELLELNRECQEMFKNNESPTKIAKHYNDKRGEIEKRHKERVKKLNAIKKKYKNKKPQADAPAQ